MTYESTQECSGVPDIGHVELVVVDQSEHNCGATFDLVVKVVNLINLLGAQHGSLVRVLRLLLWCVVCVSVSV